MLGQLMRRQQHVVGIAEQREHERKCPWQKIRILPSCPLLRPPPLSALSLLLSRPIRGEKAEGGLWLVAGTGAGWRHYTVAHYTVEHVVVCSDWRDLVPNLLNITSIRFGQESYRPDCPATYEQTTDYTPLYTTLHHTKLLTKLLCNEFQPNFCNYPHSAAKAVARKLDFYVLLCLAIRTLHRTFRCGNRGVDLKVILSGI